MRIEFGVSYFQNNDIIIDKTTILDNLPMKINDIDINLIEYLLFIRGYQKGQEIC